MYLFERYTFSYVFNTSYYLIGIFRSGKRQLKNTPGSVTDIGRTLKDRLVFLTVVSNNGHGRKMSVPSTKLQDPVEIWPREQNLTFLLSLLLPIAL